MRLEPYLERIGLVGEPKADLATLEALHRLHPLAIPFENLSTLLGEPVSLDRAALEEKLIRQQRGGYCFEHNALFQHVLEALGFELTPLAARVVWNRDKAYVNPRTHMALLVTIGRDPYLCDVGFGGATLTAPLALDPGREQKTPHEPFIINRIGDLFTISVKFADGCRDAYEFDLQPQLAIDYAAMNHYVQTWPDSPFRRVLMAARPHAGGRVALTGNELSRYASGRLIERRLLTSPESLRGVLEDDLGITLPASQALESLLARITRGKGQ